MHYCKLALFPKHTACYGRCEYAVCLQNLNMSALNFRKLYLVKILAGRVAPSAYAVCIVNENSIADAVEDSEKAAEFYGCITVVHMFLLNAAVISGYGECAPAAVISGCGTLTASAPGSSAL